MKNFATACALAAFAAVSNAEQMMVVTDADIPRVPLETSVFKNEHGSLVEENVYTDITESKITLPPKNRASDYSRQADHLKNMTNLIKKRKESNHEPIYTCSTRESPEDPTGFFDLFPVAIGDVSAANPTQHYTEGRCFDSIDMLFEQTATDSFDITMTVSGHKGIACVERFMIANTEFVHWASFKTKGTHKMSFTMGADEQADVAHGGVKIYLVCDSV